MRTALLIAAVISLGSSTALADTAVEAVHASQPAHYVQAGLMAGGAAPVAGLNIMGAIEAGKRLGGSDAWLHGAVAYGQSGDDQGPGSNFQLHAGIEWRPCGWGNRVCGVGGVDVGYQAGRWSDRDDATHRDSVDALAVVPRIGVDVGGEKVRVRLGLEADLGLVTQRDREPVSSGAGTRSSGLLGVELGAGVGYQW